MSIALAIAEIARGFGQHALLADDFDWTNQNERTVVFSYKEGSHFAKLWGLDAGSSGRNGLGGIIESFAVRPRASALTAIIVWDGLPHDRVPVISVESHITPFDWAIAFSWRLYASSVAATSRPRLRVLILDLNSGRIGNAFACSKFYAFHNSIPWVQDYSFAPEVVSDASMVTAAVDNDPVSFPWLRQALPPDQHDELALIQDLKNPYRILTTFPDHDVPNRSKVVETVHDAWRQQFVRAGDRHSVANLVGPWLLLSGLPGFRKRARQTLNRGSLVRQALLEAVESTGYLHLDDGADDRLHAALAGRNKALAPSDIRFLLIDDMYRVGFHHVLAFVLFGGRYTPDHWRPCGTGEALAFPGEGALRCESSPELLLEALQNEPAHDWRAPRHLDIPDCDILVLDLRLWTTSGGRQERLGRFVEVCRSLNIAALLSAEGTDSEIGRAYTAACLLAEGGDSEPETEALALLPLILSYLDPSLPIILFSSSHQKRLIDMVGHRANIITKFSKPILSGYADQIDGSHLISELRKAVQTAIKLHEARPIWKRIVSADWQWQPFMFDLQPPHAQRRPQAPTVSGSELRAELASFYIRY